MFSVSSVQEEVRGACSLFIVRSPYEGGGVQSILLSSGGDKVLLLTQHKRSNAQSQFVARPRWRQNSSQSHQSYRQKTSLLAANRWEVGRFSSFLFSFLQLQIT